LLDDFARRVEKLERGRTVGGDAEQDAGAAVGVAQAEGDGFVGIALE
jgi:hypothetical protein